MFTGIVTAKGRIRAITGDSVKRFEIETPWAPDGIDIGASICHAGACLTVVEKGPAGEGGWIAVEVSPETLDLTTLGSWREGDAVNLERSLKMGDELGGHLVTGHVDGLGQVEFREMRDEWMLLRIAAPDALARYIARKGSITVDGVSLTVNAVQGRVFDLMIIPHTAEVTTLGGLQAGDRVNLEVDLMARYAARLAEYQPEEA